jgi:cobalamin biosynthesis protein CobT
MLEDKYHKANLAGVTERADAPIEEALALMVREKLTGRARAKERRKGGRPVARLDRGQGRRRPRRPSDRL